MRTKILIHSIAVALACGTSIARATDWLQFGFDQAHTGFNTAETGFSTAGNKILLAGIEVKTAGASPSTKSIDSAPIFASGVLVNGTPTDLLFIVSKDGTLLAVNASTGTTVWSQAHTSTGGNLTTGSPAVDPSKQNVYAYALDGKVHRYAIATGVEATGSAHGNWPWTSTLKPDAEKGAAGLAIVTANNHTYLYSVTDGYIGDGNDYQGHLSAFDITNPNAVTKKVFNTECSTVTQLFDESGNEPADCSSVQNGIWGRPGVTYDSVTQRIFISTGNGPYDASTGGHDWGDSVLALNPDGSGSGSGMPLDSYTPDAFLNLKNTDADIGSESLAILVPGKIGLHASKDGCVRLLNIANLSGLGGPAHTGGELAKYQFYNVVTNNCDTGDDANRNGGSSNDELKPQPAVWTNPADGSVWAYIASNSGFAAYQLTVPVSGNPTLAKIWNTSGGSSPVVANGTVYYEQINGTVVALDAATGHSIWSAPITGPHWQSLIVVNGKIFAVDGGSKLWSFQLDGIFRSNLDAHGT